MRLPIAILAVLVTPAAHGQDRLNGRWRGYWTRAGDTMLVTLDVRPDTGAGRYVATFEAERLRVSGIPFNEVRLVGCCDVSMELRGDRTTAVFTGTITGDSLSGTLRENPGSDGRFAYVRVAGAEPSFEEREVTFANGTVVLAGTLLLPATGNGLAGVVFLHGSGAEGRWASRYLATRLAERGIAALIFDKRGVGRSSGNWREAALEELAGDGAAAVARLREEPRVDRARIGLHGNSQGGTLAPLVAARAPAVAFVIGSAAAGVATDSTEIFSILNAVYPRAPSARDSAAALDYVSELVAVANHGWPRARLDSLVAALQDRPWFFAPPPPGDFYWWFSPQFARYRPLEWWSRVRVPVLLLYGGQDQRVPAARSAERIAAALRLAGNHDVTVHIYPGADHTFRLPPGPGGWPLTAPGYLPNLLEWLSRR